MSKIKYDTKELCLIWLDSFIGLEYKHKKELYNLINGKTEIRAVLVDGKEYVERALGAEKYSFLLSSANSVYLDYVLDGLEKRNITAVTLESKDYPELLKNTSLPPLVLYAKGDVKLLNSECFAVVGSRKSLPISLKIAKDYVEELIDSGFTPVTGIAEGVDKSVIDTALEKNGKVISVLGGGFDNIYPAQHLNLVNEIVERGLIITEYPPEIPAKPYHFPIRNRIIAGLSRATLVVSAGKKSGTLYTAEYALDYGRDLFVVPYSVGVSSGAGCNELIKNGGALTDTPQDIFGIYGIKKKETKKPALTDEERQILGVLTEGGAHIEKIARDVNKQVYEISSTLSIMEIKGLVVKTGVNVYGLTKTYSEE